MLAAGRVSRAAKVLGIARKNLYNRMAVLGIDPNAYRGDMTPSVTVTEGVTLKELPKVTGMNHSHGVAGSVSVFRSDTLKRRGRRRTLANVSERVAVAEPEPEVKKQLRQARSVYLRPDQWKEVDDACFDIAAHRREKHSPSKLMEEFHDAYFKMWRDRILKRNGR